MGLFDAYKKNLSEIVNATSEKFQASMNSSAAQNSSQTHTSDDNHLSTQLLKVINQLDTLQEEVARLSGVVSHQQKQLDDANRQISELKQTRTTGTNASTTDSSAQPEVDISEIKEELDRWVKLYTFQYEGVQRQIGNLLDLLEKHWDRIKLIEAHTFM